MKINENGLHGLAKWIVLEGLMDESVAIKAQERSKTADNCFVNYIIQNDLIDPLDLANKLASSFGMPLFDLNTFDTQLIPKDLVCPELIKRHQLLPLCKKGDYLSVAIADPLNQHGLNEIKFYTGLHIKTILVEADKLSKLISKTLGGHKENILNQIKNNDLKEEHSTPLIGTETNDAPIIQFIHQLLFDAIQKNASDIHFEPYDKKYRIRMRHDGILYDNINPPIALANRISSCIKVMSQLDISERRLPQDGRFRIDPKTLSANKAITQIIDCRVSTCPTVTGEKVVIRLLDEASANIGVDNLGFDAIQKELFLKALQQPQGMILVTGPTGSGKTVTLYTALNILNTTHKNILTIEDPVEIHVPGINQVNINTKAGLTFASAMRAFLRQDPDIIMVGEMRDKETAEIGIKAAQTGHLVLSTLHTNSATETLTRLFNLGLPNYNIATSISLIIAQRLIRKLCVFCKKQEKMPPDTLIKEGLSIKAAHSQQIYKANGCSKCTQGYKGRVGIFEMLPVTNAISDAILSNKNALQLLSLAKKEGMITLRKSGLHKVQCGITSLEEINRITTN